MRSRSSSARYGSAGAGRQPVLARAGEDARRRRRRRAGSATVVGSATADIAADHGRAPDGTPLPWIGCSRCAGNAVLTASGHPRSCARSRAGTTPARPPPRALTFIGAGLDADALRADRPRGVRRLPVDRARACAWSTALARKIEWPEFEFYEARVPRAPRDLSCSAAPSRRCAGATFCEHGDRARRGDRRPDGRHDGRAAGRRPAHAPGLDHRPGLRPGA